MSIKERILEQAGTTGMACHAPYAHQRCAPHMAPLSAVDGHRPFSPIRSPPGTIAVAPSQPVFDKPPDSGVSADFSVAAAAVAASHLLSCFYYFDSSSSLGWRFAGRTTTKCRCTLTNISPPGHAPYADSSLQDGFPGSQVSFLAPPPHKGSCRLFSFPLQWVSWSRRPTP